MRIALLTNFIPPYRVSFLQALAARAGELRILVSTAMEADRPWPADWHNLDVVRQRTLAMPQTWTTPEFRERVTVYVPLDTSNRLDAFRPDVIVTGEFGARSLAAVRYARSRGIPVALWATVSDQTDAARGWLRRLLRRWLLQRVNLVFVNGESGARYLRRFDVPDARMVRVPYTTALAPFLAVTHDAAPPSSFRVLFVGNLSERKAPDRLLMAARSIADPDRPLSLTFVGDGPLRARLEAMAAHRTPGLSVSFAGAVDYADLPRFYANADLLAFPTLADEWGLVVNEALAAAVPVLGSVFSQAVEELIEHERNGWLLRDCEPDAIAAMLKHCRDTPRAELEQMRVEARRSALALSPERAADTMTNALHALVNQPAPLPAPG